MLIIVHNVLIIIIMILIYKNVCSNVRLVHMPIIHINNVDYVNSHVLFVILVYVCNVWYRISYIMGIVIVNVQLDIMPMLIIVVINVWMFVRYVLLRMFVLNVSMGILLMLVKYV